MICLRMPSDLIVFGYVKGCGWQCFVFAGHRTWLSLDRKMGADDHFCLLVASDLIVFKLQRGCGLPCFVCACHLTWLSLDGEEGTDDHVLSLRAIGLDCLWVAKRVRMIIFCLRMPSDLIVLVLQNGCGWPCFVSVCHRTWFSLDTKKGTDYHVCLCVPSDLIVSR